MRLTKLLLPALLGASFSPAQTSLTAGTWTTVISNGTYGVSFGTISNVNAAYINSLNAMCSYNELFGAYTTETGNAEILCFSYERQNAFVLEAGEGVHTAHRPPHGHPDNTLTYNSDLDMIMFAVDGAWGNIEENYLGWWMFDVAGLTGSDRPLPTYSGISAPGVRPWSTTGGSQGVNPGDESGVYDTTNHVWVVYPDYQTDNQHVSICNAAFSGTNDGLAPGTCVSVAGGPATSLNTSAAFDSTNGLTYYYLGGSTGAVYTFNAATQTWATITPASGSVPPTRTNPMWAYSSVDNAFLMSSGYVGSGTCGANTTANCKDTWVFCPTANNAVCGGSNAANTWQLLCDTTGGCAAFVNSSALVNVGNRLAYSPTDNVFLSMNSGTVQAFGLAGSGQSLQQYGRSSHTYAPHSGSLNRVAPPSSPGNISAETLAADPSIATDGTHTYIASVQTALASDSNSACLDLTPYVWESGGTGYLPGGTLDSGCIAVGFNGFNAGKMAYHPVTGIVNGQIWLAFGANYFFAGESANARTFAGTYSSGTWSTDGNISNGTNNEIPCFISGCSNGNENNSPVQLIAVGTSPTLAVQEHVLGSTAQNLYVAQFGGTSWAQVGSGPINAGGSYAASGTIATDGGGTNIEACWAEQVNTNKEILQTTPQIKCRLWTGSSWGATSSSLNQSGADWAYTPSLTYAGGNWYVAFVEKSQLGAGKVYLEKSSDGVTWTLVGSGALNNNTSTGTAYHPSIATDGTNIFIAWEEQSAINQHALGYIKEWNGSAFTSVAGPIAADTTNGSIADISLVYTGMLTAAWTETSTGNLPQLYSNSWRPNVPPLWPLPFPVQ